MYKKRIASDHRHEYMFLLSGIFYTKTEFNKRMIKIYKKSSFALCSRLRRVDVKRCDGCQKSE